jgi:hypothetical protein
MSEGSVFKRKDGKYCAKYKGADGTWKYLYRRTKTEAKKALREALKLRDEGKTPVTRNGVTVGESLESYLVHIQSRCLVMRYSGNHEASNLCTFAFRQLARGTGDGFCAPKALSRALRRAQILLASSRGERSPSR